MDADYYDKNKEKNFERERMRMAFLAGTTFTSAPPTITTLQPTPSWVRAAPPQPPAATSSSFVIKQFYFHPFTKNCVPLYHTRKRLLITFVIYY